MDNNNTHSEKLVRYLDGELNESEAEALRAELETNTAMHQEMDALILAKNAIKNYGVTQKVNGIHQEMMLEMMTSHNSTKARVRSLPKMIMRIAASVIILTGLFGLYQYIAVSRGNLYNEQYVAYQIATMRGSTGNSEMEKAYSENKYDEVIALYKQTANPGINEQFLAAQAYVNRVDFSAAITEFNTIIQKNKDAGTTTLNDDAEYYLALSYLKNNEIAKALPLFEKIHDDKEHLYHSRVSTWYIAKVKLLNWKN